MEVIIKDPNSNPPIITICGQAAQPMDIITLDSTDTAGAGGRLAGEIVAGWAVHMPPELRRPAARWLAQCPACVALARQVAGAATAGAARISTAAGAAAHRRALVHARKTRWS